MEQIVQQLGKLLLGALPTFLILLALFVFLRIVFFSPLEKLLAERHAATGGAKESALQSIASAEAKAAEYAAALDQARSETYKVREADRQKTLEVRAELVARTRAAAAARISEARAQIQGDVAASRVRLAEQSHALAESITKAILR